MNKCRDCDKKIKEGSLLYCDGCKNIRFKESQKRYRSSEEYKAKQRDRYHDPKTKIKEKTKKYHNSLGFKKWLVEYKKTDKYIIHQRKQSWRQQGIDITYEEFLILKEKSGDCCYICGRHRDKFKVELSVDHNHKTGKIRGLLCYNCNKNVGFIEGDNYKNALDYLDRYNL